MQSQFVSYNVPAQLRLGIAITTLNRRQLVVRLVDIIRQFTTTKYELVVCDDGSQDGTVETLRALGIPTIVGQNRGIAWNKNRGIYYLLNIARCDVILLLDDDVIPTHIGWDQPWVAATWRHGHVNVAHQGHLSEWEGGEGTPEDPGMTGVVGGWAFAFSRRALAELGYLDLRFGRYGHEHSDFSFRALRAGYGGVTVGLPPTQRELFFVVRSGLEVVPATSCGTAEELEANQGLLVKSANEPVYRHAWRDDHERSAFLSEISGASPEPVRTTLVAPPPRFVSFPSLDAYRSTAAPIGTRSDNISLHKAATQSSYSIWSLGGTKERDAAGAVNGILDGSRHFHTDLEDNPWWQVDLGSPAVIKEIRIYNTVDGTRGRFCDFIISTSTDGCGWSAVAKRTGGVPLVNCFVWSATREVFARFVRVTTLGHSYLHLCQVEVYGRVLDDS